MSYSIGNAFNSSIVCSTFSSDHSMLFTSTEPFDQSQRSVCERKLSGIELAVICESCFRKLKTLESSHDTHKIFFRKSLSKATFERNFPVCHDLKPKAKVVKPKVSKAAGGKGKKPAARK